MDIVIISEFCEDFSKSDNDRFFYLAKMITGVVGDRNCNDTVEIITSSFRHTTKSQRLRPTEIWPFKITFIKEPGYPKNVCLRRFYSHYVWGKNLIEYLECRAKKPDIIYCAVPSLTGPNLVAKYCERENIKFIIDVQDLWPEAFQMVINIPVVSNIIFSPFKLMANGIYKRADVICAVSDTYCQRAKSVNTKAKDTTTVFLGTELATFDRYASDNPILEKEVGEIWLAYCGTLGSSYDLTCVIDALALLNNPNLRFIVMGDGPKLDEFKRYAEQKAVRAEFVGRLQYHAMCSLLSACDITVNPITHMAAQSIINKHADYAASGLPVVSTQESSEYRKLIEDYQMGLNCRNNDANDLAEKLKRLVDNETLRVEMGHNARRCAEERFDRAAAYKALEDQILINGGGYCGLVKTQREIWIGYAGTLGTSYDLPVVFNAIRKINNPNLRFIVMGDGPMMDAFMKKAVGLNVTFLGRIEYSQMCGVLVACDMVVNPIVGTSVATIINKHADYAASGKPVLNTQKSEEYRKLINNYQMGYSCDDENALVERILELIDDITLRRKQGLAARKAAEEQFDRRNSYKLLTAAIGI